VSCARRQAFVTDISIQYEVTLANMAQINFEYLTNLNTQGMPSSNEYAISPHQDQPPPSMLPTSPDPQASEHANDFTATSQQNQSPNEVFPPPRNTRTNPPPAGATGDMTSRWFDTRSQPVRRRVLTDDY
jgi:hypothetical protein